MATQLIEQSPTKQQVAKKAAPRAKAPVQKTKASATKAKTSSSKAKPKAKLIQTTTDTTTQMNVRLGKALHEEGNAALASIGVSPSEAVRALWEKAAKRGEDLEEIRKLLFSKDAGSNDHEEQMRLVQEGQQLFRNGMAQLGIDIDKLPLDTRTYEEIRDEMYAEMLKEMGY